MNGFLNLQKRKGFTSHDMVLYVRRRFPKVKIGHLGTLDPFAVGVLPLALGSYTKLTRYLLGSDKEYLSEFEFGVRTDTGDKDGNVLSQGDASWITPQRVEEEMRSFLGTIQQVPPMYSAIKVKGRKLYELARKGVTCKVEPRTVHVKEFRLVGWQKGLRPKGLFSIKVSGGTYVRALASDLGEKLSSGAHVSYLLRKKAGRFFLKDSITLDALERNLHLHTEESLFQNPLDVLGEFPKALLKEEALHKVSHGKQLLLSDFEESSLDVGDMPLFAFIKPQGRPEVVASLRMEDGKLKYDNVLV